MITTIVGIAVIGSAHKALPHEEAIHAPLENTRATSAFRADQLPDTILV